VQSTNAASAAETVQGGGILPTCSTGTQHTRPVHRSGSCRVTKLAIPLLPTCTSPLPEKTHNCLPRGQLIPGFRPQACLHHRHIVVLVGPPPPRPRPWPSSFVITTTTSTPRSQNPPRWPHDTSNHTSPATPPTRPRPRWTTRAPAPSPDHRRTRRRRCPRRRSINALPPAAQSPP
jgi:hypothetical protein